MASLYKKVVSGKPYWYLREMGWADGKPKLISDRYLGTGADIEALLDAREAAALPDRTRHLAFGDVAAAWGMLADLGVAAIIGQAARARRSDAGASAGTYLVLAALNRLVAPCSKLGFADWWKTTAGDRFARIGAGVLDHRRFWDAMQAVTLEQLEEASQKIALAIVDLFAVDCSSVALDMTNFATFIDTSNKKAPVAQRGKAKQKRSDLRLVGLGLVVTRDGGIPLTWHAYPGNRPDVTQFRAMIGQLTRQYEAITTAVPGASGGADMTVVFDAGQNSQDNFDYLAGTGLRYVGSVPASDCPARPRPRPGLPRPLHRAARLRPPPHRLRHRQARHPDPLTRAARLAGPGVRRHHPGQGRPQARRAGRHPGPRQGPPPPGEGRSRDHRDHGQALGPAGHQLAARRRQAPRPAPELGHRHRRPGRPGRRTVRQARPDHRPRRLASGRRHRGLPVPVRGRVLLPPDERPERGVVLPDAPLDRAQHPRPRLHLRPAPADPPPQAPPAPPRRAGPVRPRTAQPARRHRRDRPDLPLHRRPPQSPPHDHRAHQRPAAAI